MLKQPGDAIKQLAILVFVLLLIGTAIGAVSTGKTEGIWLGVAVALGGFFISWVAVIGMYAFGSLVEDAQKTREAIERIERMKRKEMSHPNKAER